MANFLTNFVARVSVSAIVGAAVGAAVVTYARNPGVEALKGDGKALSERIAALENGAMERQAALISALEAIRRDQAAHESDMRDVTEAAAAAGAAAQTAAADAQATAAAAGVEADAGLAARLDALDAALAELGARIDAIPAPAPAAAPAPAVDLTPILEALARLEARPVAP